MLIPQPWENPLTISLPPNSLTILLYLLIIGSRILNFIQCYLWWLSWTSSELKASSNGTMKLVSFRWTVLYQELAVEPKSVTNLSGARGQTILTVSVCFPKALSRLLRCIYWCCASPWIHMMVCLWCLGWKMVRLSSLCRFPDSIGIIYIKTI